MKHFDNRYHYVIDGTRFSYPTRIENLEQYLLDPNSDEEKQFAKDQLLERLRSERNYLLKQSDWWAVADRTMTSEQTAYRTALRDLPANSPNVALDEKGNLINVTWPTKPE